MKRKSSYASDSRSIFAHLIYQILVHRFGRNVLIVGPVIVDDIGLFYNTCQDEKFNMIS